jgi:hypothetical protein
MQNHPNVKVDEIVHEDVNNNNSFAHHLHPGLLTTSFDRSRQSFSPLLASPYRFSIIRPSLINENIDEESEEEVQRMLGEEESVESLENNSQQRCIEENEIICDTAL